MRPMACCSTKRRPLAVVFAARLPTLVFAAVCAGRQLFDRTLQGLVGDFFNGAIDGITAVTGGLVNNVGQMAGAAVGGDAGAAIQQGASELGNAVAEGGDLLGDGARVVVDAAVEATDEVMAAIYNGRKCYLSILRGVRLGGIVGPEGAIVGGAVGAVLSAGDWIDAVKYAWGAGKEVLDSTRASLADIHCPPDATPMTDPQVGRPATPARHRCAAQ